MNLSGNEHILKHYWLSFPFIDSNSRCFPFSNWFGLLTNMFILIGASLVNIYIKKQVWQTEL